MKNILPNGWTEYRYIPKLNIKSRGFVTRLSEYVTN